MNRSAAEDTALLLLRLAGFGLAFGHGLGKFVLLTTGEGEPLVRIVAGLGFPLPTFFTWVATLSELVGGLLIGFGIWTRVAAGFAAATMTVAAFLRHHMHRHILSFIGLVPVPDETRQRWGDPELAFAYLVICLALILLGGGRYSLQRLLRKPRRLFGP